MKRLLFLPLLLIVWGSIISSAVAAGEPTIRVVIAADGRAGFGANLVADYKNMERLFRNNIPKAQLDLRTMEMSEITPDTILDTIAKLKLDTNDTLVFYYSGHAANDAGNGGHYFQLKDKNGKTVELQRRTLLSAMKGKGARLTVLLTDCCNIDMKSSGTSKNTETATATPETISPVFEALFLRPRGVVDITSSKRGEASFVDTTAKKRGSCFTWPFVALCEKHRDAKAITWSDFVTELKRDVQKAFLESWPDGYKFDPPINGLSFQKTQTVEVYDIPDKQNLAVSPTGPRFGVRAVTHSPGGVRVTEVVPNGAGYRAGFEIGDIITEINGKTIRNEDDYSKAVDESPKKMQAKLINVNDGRTLNVTFELAR